MQKYVKIYYDWKKVTETLSDAEKGRLIDAVVTYAESGEAVQLSGAERHVFPTIREQINRDNADYSSSVENGKKGGRPTKRVSEKNLNNFRLSNENLKNQDKDKEEDEDKDKDKDKDNTPHKPPKGGFDAFVKKAFYDFADGNAELLDALTEFAAMRKRIKAPIATEQTVTRLLNKLQTDFQRYEWVDILNQSTDNGWKGIFPLKTDKTAKRRQSTNPFVEMLKEEQYEQF